MRTLDPEIRPQLKQAVRAGWNPVEIHSDRPKTPATFDSLVRTRINLLDWESEPQGRAAASQDVVIPHTYEIEGEWKYPAAPATVSEAQQARVNELLPLLTQDWPRFAGWAFRESVRVEYEDDGAEETYRVRITFTLECIVSARG